MEKYSIYKCARRVSVSLAAATCCCCCCLPQASFVYEEIVANKGIRGGDVKVSQRLALYNDLFNFARIAVTTLMDCPPPDLLYGASPTGRCTRYATPPLTSASGMCPLYVLKHRRRITVRYVGPTIHRRVLNDGFIRSQELYPRVVVVCFLPTMCITNGLQR